MKIYLLRHQIRYPTVTFDTELTNYGKNLANTQTCYELSKLGITKIYSSPFLRVLQTIGPYVNKYNKSVNIEYALSEYVNGFDLKIHPIPNEWYNRYKINRYYASVVNPKEANNVEKRVEFIHYLLKRYKNTNEKILLASHQFPIHYIMRYFGKDIPRNGINMGKIVEIIL